MLFKEKRYLLEKPYEHTNTSISRMQRSSMLKHVVHVDQFGLKA